MKLEVSQKRGIVSVRFMVVPHIVRISSSSEGCDGFAGRLGLVRVVIWLGRRGGGKRKEWMFPGSLRRARWEIKGTRVLRMVSDSDASCSHTTKRSAFRRETRRAVGRSSCCPQQFVVHFDVLVQLLVEYKSRLISHRIWNTLPDLAGRAS